MANSFHLSYEAIATAIHQFEGVAHRMELVREWGGVRYINNSMCTNPAAVEASAEASPKPLIAISGGYHKGGDLSGMAASLAKNACRVLLIGQAAPALAAALTAQNYTNFETADTLPEAVTRAAALAAPGDTVMLIPGCASFDMFSGFEERGQVFRDAVKAIG
jgi:UDP-N-acetylmuramoylalanine--D-glutamate ligase